MLGGNGAGKSTLLKLASALLLPDKGRVVVAGIDSRDDPLVAKQRSAYLPETIRMDELLTVAEVLAFVADLRGVPHTGIDRLCELFFLTEHRHTLFGQLSFGSRRKLGLVAAFLAAAPVMVLDEPDTGLDVVAVNALEGQLAVHRGAGGTVLLSSHDMAFVARTCDQLVVLNGGQVQWQGPPTQLVSESGADDLHGAVTRLLSEPAATAEGVT